MRYNTFYQIHKALRAMLYETAIELQRTDFNNDEETAGALTNIENIVNLFDKHAHHEDTLVFPAVEKYEPSVVDAFEQEHVKDHELCGKLRMLISMFDSLESDEEKVQLGSAIRKSFVEFLTFNLDHMAKEEDIINNLLWRYYTDDEIRAIEYQVVARQTPEATATAWKWMLRGLSNLEITRWLKMVEKNAPEVVFNNLFSMAEKELSNVRFRQVLEGLTEGAMLA